MNRSEKFWETVRGEQDLACARNRYLADAASRRALPWPARRAGNGWALAAAFPMVAAIALGVMLWRARVVPGLAFTAEGEVGRVGAWIAAPPTRPLPLAFSDGSRVSLNAGSRARVTATDANGAHIVIERGGASAAVAHRSTSHWTIEVGPFEVAVVGTLFDVNWDASEEVFRLDLHEGSVLVSGPCMQEPRTVGRGHRLRVSCRTSHDEIVETRDESSGLDALGPNADSAGTSESAAADAGEADPREAPIRARAVAVAASPPYMLRSDAWRDLVAAARYRDALDLVEHGGFDEQCRRAAGSDLVELGDVARFAGDARRARQAYVAARSKLPGGGRSAYGLGLTAFDQEGDFPGAARWFETYLAEQPHGDLRREAEGRAMEAWQRAGAHDRARAAAQDYLRQYPDGAQAPLARQLAASP